MAQSMKGTGACGVCGHPATSREPTPVVQAPAPGLRPPDVDVGMLARFVSECGACGYCTADLTRATTAAISLVRSARYRALRGEPGVPSLVRRFRQAAAVAEIDGYLADAAWHRLRGGWVAEDVGADRVAAEERRAAVNLIGLLKDRNLWAPDVPGAAELVMADLLRGVGDWPGAEHAVRQALALVAAPELKALAERQFDLVARRASTNHRDGGSSVN